MFSDNIVDVMPGFTHEGASCFAALGEYVTSYQQIEDFLPCLFVNAMAGNYARDHAIFAAVRGLEGKLDLIGAAVSVHQDEDVRAIWPDIQRRIAAAAAARNQMAHARPVTYGPVDWIEYEEDTYDFDQPNPEFQIRKSNRSGDRVWNEEALRRELKVIAELHVDLSQFCTDVIGI